MADRDMATESAKRKRYESPNASDADDDSDRTSPSHKKFRRRRLLHSPSPRCLFRRGLMSTSSNASSNSRSGPTTSKWTMEHLRRLNFDFIDVPKYVFVSPTEYASCFDFCVKNPLIKILFEDLRDDIVLARPDVVDDDLIESLRTQNYADDCIMRYLEAVYKNLRLSTCRTLVDEDTLMQCMTDTAADYTDTIPEYLMGYFIQSMTLINNVYINGATETHKDEAIRSMIQLIVNKECLVGYYRIRIRSETRQQFSVCGECVTSQTNTLVLQTKVPIVLSEHRSTVRSCTVRPNVLRGKRNVPASSMRTNGTELAGEPTSTGTGTRSGPPAPTQTTFTRKFVIPREFISPQSLPQVVLQSLSVADESPFQTDNYKIVYHVSWASSSRIVVYRTLVAKSTLQAMKGECEMPSGDKLDTSYVCAMEFDVKSAPFLCFQVLYVAFSSLIKVANEKIPKYK
ncbi:uncharacterized protein [Ptychodera flava]|uniref:uncharacterized protein n=1 Tax=Ptychodera flava TaxID=63121 RepID=UPI00396A3B07